MSRSAAEIVREYGPFPGVDHVHGVTYDGQHVWFAAGDKLNAFDPASGKTLRSIDVAAHAGTAFDGQHLFQLAEDRIQKIDPKTGRVLATIPAPGGGGDSGLTWAEGTLWVGQYRDRKIHQIDPETGAILRTIESNRFVTGVTWVDGELWHGTWEGDESDLRRVDPRTGEVLERLEMPPGVGVSGLESDGGDQFFCGGGRSGKVRAVRRPSRLRDGPGFPTSPLSKRQSRASFLHLDGPVLAEREAPKATRARRNSAYCKRSLFSRGVDSSRARRPRSAHLCRTSVASYRLRLQGEDHPGRAELVSEQPKPDREERLLHRHEDLPAVGEQRLDALGLVCAVDA